MHRSVIEPGGCQELGVWGFPDTIIRSSFESVVDVLTILLRLQIYVVRGSVASASEFVWCIQVHREVYLFTISYQETYREFKQKTRRLHSPLMLVQLHTNRIFGPRRRYAGCIPLVGVDHARHKDSAWHVVYCTRYVRCLWDEHSTLSVSSNSWDIGYADAWYTRRVSLLS